MKNIFKQKRLTACVVGVAMLLGGLSVSVNAQTEVQTVQAMIDKHRTEYAELTPLMEECKNRGMQLEYDEINYNVLGQFPNYMEENLSKGSTENAAEQDRELTELYKKTKENLIAYLGGTRQPLSAPTYVTSDISVVNKHFEATVDNDGTLEKQPVFFVGTGHQWASRSEIPILSKFGFNAIQPELGGNSFMSRETFPIYNWTERKVGEYPVDYQIVTEQKHGGAQALKLESTTSQKENNYWYMKQTVQVKPNTTYRYGLWAKAPAGAAGTWFHVHPNWEWNTRNWVSGVVADWKEISAEYTTGADEHTLTFVICIEKPTEVWMDDIYIKEKGSDINLLLNGDFEKTERDESSYWKINEEEIGGLAKDFDLMAEHNLSGIFNVGAHGIPEVYREDYPEIHSAQNWIFSTNTLLDHPKVKKYYADYYNAIMPALAGKPAFDGIILMNEPVYITYKDSAYYLPLFQEAMEEKYNDIASLNSKWGTNYTDFEQVTMPIAQEATPQFHDWRQFNDQVLARYHQYAAGLVKKYDTNVLVQTKMQQNMMYTNTFQRFGSANNWEALAPTLDINSCDAFTNSAQRNRLDIRTQDIFYDYQTSVKNAPIYNSEEHLYLDAEEISFSEVERAYNTAALWQGAVHGKGGTIIWPWNRQNEQNSYSLALKERPATVAAIGKTTLDLNRLAKEIVSISEAKANVGMLYAAENIPYADDYMNAIYTAYAKLGENGQKTQFIATETEASLEKMSDLKCLIIPHVVAVNDAGFNAVKRFVESGGRLVVLGSDSLSKDMYGRTRDASSVLQNAEVVEISANRGNLTAECAAKVGEAVSNAVGNDGSIRIIDTATGKPLTDCEYLCSEYDGNTIINLCSYSETDKEIEIYRNGQKVKAFTDLISTETYKGSAAVKAYTPMLISVEAGVHTDNIIRELHNNAEIDGVSYSSEEAYEGKWSLYVNRSELNWYPIAARCAAFGMATGGKYDISFCFKGDIKTLYITAEGLCIANNTPYLSGTKYPDVGQTVTGPDANGWYKFEVKGYTLQGENQALLFLQDYNGVNRFYLDKLSVVDTATGKELIENGGFEPAVPAAPEEEPIRKHAPNIKELLNDVVVDGVSYSAKEAYEGDWSVYINHSVKDWYPIAARCAAFGMATGGKYDISFCFKGDIKTLYITAEGLCIANNAPYLSGTKYPDVGQTVTGPDANGWYKFEVKDYILQSENQALLFLQDYNGVNRFYLDKLSVVDTATGKELIENGGFEPPAIEFGEYYTESNTDGTTTIRIEALNHSAGNNAAPQFVFAAYDSGERLVSCTPVETLTPIAQNNTWQSITYMIPTNNGDKVVAYIWDSFVNLKPLWQAKTIIN